MDGGSIPPGSTIWRYAVATGRTQRDPSGDLRGALPPVKGEHFAAITEPNRAAELLKAIDGYAGDARCALPPWSRAAGRVSGHGFRAMARTILDEVLGVRPDFIEHQLAHAVRDPNGRAYNRTAHLPERRKMMQAWADYLDTLKVGGNVTPIKRTGTPG